jgi:sarcosine oxidase, subunit gamma
MSSEKTVSMPAFDQGVSPRARSKTSDQSVSIELVGEKSRFSLRLRERDIEAFSQASGISLSSEIGMTERVDDVEVLRLGPDEWLLVTVPEQGAAVIEKCARFTAAPYSLVDVSHRNVALRISGEGAAALINMGCPLDLAPGAFPVGKCTRTVFERAEIILSRTGEADFHIELWRSFAPYLLSLLERGRQD